MKRPAKFLPGIFLLAMFTLSACVRRTVTVVSQPPGVLVYLNNQEIGRTPVTHDFIWYGSFDVVLRKDGYQTLKTHRWITAPLWQWFPFDLLADISPVPLHDEHTIGFIMDPIAATQSADPMVMMARAMELHGKLESSEHTRSPATNPTSKPARVPSTNPNSKPRVKQN